jgi:hypothetical protein
VKIEKQKQILPLRGRMTTKKPKAKQKQIPSLRCGMTNKAALRNDKQKRKGA